MPAYRFPILVWEDYDGGFTASIVHGGMDAAAFAESAGEAVEQVREFLRWRYKAQPWRPGPDFLDAELAHVKVEVRPEYRAEGDGAESEARPRRGRGSAGPPGPERVYACN